MVDVATVLEQIKTYCEVRFPVRPLSDPDFPTHGCGNTRHVEKIVMLAIKWIEGDADARRAISYRPSQITLADLAGMAAHEVMCRNFSWQEVCQVVKSAGEASLWTGRLDRLAAKHPGAVERFRGLEIDFGNGMNVKRVVQKLAETILWAQSFAFLTEHGYTMPEK